MAKVFVTHHYSKGDFALVEAWGEITFITKKEHRCVPANKAVNHAVYHDVQLILNGQYIQGIDFILLAPNPILSMIVGTLLGPGIHQILKWNSKCKEYRLHLLEVN